MTRCSDEECAWFGVRVPESHTHEPYNSESFVEYDEQVEELSRSWGPTTVRF